MFDILKDALKSIAENSPITLVFILIVWYLYRELKEARSLIRELYSMRIQDLKDLSSSQDEINESINDLVEEIGGEGDE